MKTVNLIGHSASFEITKPSLLTDEEISALWHEAQEQPFKFARLIERKIREQTDNAG
jgi:hypothetical protein